RDLKEDSAMSERSITTTSAAMQRSISNLDVDAIGIASADSLKGTKLAEAAFHLLPETNSIVVLAMEVYPEVLDLSRPGRMMGVASFNDLLDRHVEFLCGRLTKTAYDVAKFSHSHGLKALPLPASGCPMDMRFYEAVFSYKHAAQVAGVGYIGRSSLLITPDFGPRVRLSCCLTEAVLEPQKKVTAEECQSCRICIDSCPAQALDRPPGEESYIINKFACASFQNASGGCSECIRLCPVSR
ncbi:hypothetical protein ACFLWK_01685, partial [Chloroflexota bacterium]